jgi:adenylate kinase
LNLEHVSAANIVRQEISRRSPIGQQASRAIDRGQPVPDQLILGVMRRWFWARKPDAGFVLCDFPATLLQAQVFEEWLDARGTTLTACVVDDDAEAPPSILDHYRTHGVPFCDSETLFAA